MTNVQPLVPHVVAMIEVSDSSALTGHRLVLETFLRRPRRLARPTDGSVSSSGSTSDKCGAFESRFSEDARLARPFSTGGTCLRPLPQQARHRAETNDGNFTLVNTLTRSSERVSPLVTVGRLVRDCQQDWAVTASRNRMVA